MKTARSHPFVRILAALALACVLSPAAALAQTFTLTVTVNGNGAGFVSGALFCPGPAQCTASFGSGAQVNLNQFTADGSNHFAGWGGCDSSSPTACSLAMTGDRTVTATFDPQATTAEPVQSVLGAGDQFICALSSAGGVKCWGNDGLGQLGNNDASHVLQDSPVDVSGLTSGVIDLSVGISHACALTSAGGVKCWGLNDRGQLGDGSTTNRDAPVDVTGLASGVVKVAAGGDHTCALTAAGGVKCWGAGTFGQLGNNATQDHSTPVDVTGLTEVVTALASGGGHSCALTQAGGLKCWGAGQDGENGSGGGGIFPSPVDVSGLTSGVVSFSLGKTHSCAVTSAGAALCWGLNASGQLGDTTQTSRFVPTPVSGLSSGVASIATRYDHTCAVMASGSLECWGKNNSFQLGTSNIGNESAPVDVQDITGGVMALAPGSGSTCALMAAGRVFCWGSLPTPPHTTQNFIGPRLVRAFGGIADLDAGFSHTCAATTTGARCWGFSIWGIGDGFNSERDAPVDVQELGVGALKVAASDGMSCLITESGGVKCWGLGFSPGGMGNGVDASSGVPVDVSGISSGATDIAVGQFHGCAVQFGNVKCWGANYAGQLGTGDTGANLVPYTQPGINDAMQVAAGQYHTCVVHSGAVACWGRNNSGQLGDGTFTDSYVPVTPTGLTSGVVQVVAGAEYNCALTNAGAVLCWGKNQNLQLGQGGSSTSSLGAPSPVPALTSGVIALTAQNTHTCALMADSSVQCWGSNSSGELGDGTHMQRSTPAPVSGLGHDVESVSAGAGYTCVLTWGGTVKCWGTNSNGQFGNGTTTSSDTPQGGGVLGQTLDLSVPVALAQGTPGAITATASSGLTPTLSSWTSNCAVTATTVTINSGGRCGVVASQPGNSHVFAAPSPVRIASASGLTPQTIAFQAIQGTQFTNFGFTFVFATGGGSGNAVIYSSLTPSVCTATGTSGKVNFTPAGGTCTIAADQAGNATYLAASQATISFQVTVSTQTLTVVKNGAGNGTVTGNGIDCGSTCSVQLPWGTQVSLTATPDANSRFVSWNGCSSTNVCSGSLNGNATVTVTFAQANLPQSITFDPDPLPDSSIADFQYFYSVSASSGLPVTVTSLTPDVCESESAGFAVLLATGTCTLAADQPGNATYAAAPEAQRSFEVTSSGDFFSVIKNGAGSGYVSGGPIDCGTTCSSTVAPGTPITLTAVADSGSLFGGWSGCDSATGNVCNVTVQSDGQSVSVLFTGSTAQSITFNQPADRGIGETPITMGATASSGLPVRFNSLTFGVCQTGGINGNVVTLVAQGVCTIRALQDGDATYAPAASVDRSFNVLQDPPQPFVEAAHYRLGEDDPGATVGAVGNAATMDAAGGFPLGRVNTPHYAAGAVGSGTGVALNGTGDGYASTGTVTDAVRNFGVEVWVKSNGSTSGNAFLAFTGNGSFSGFGLLRLGGSYAGLLGGVDIAAGNNEIPVTTAWTHLALVRNNDITQVYVNGVPMGSTSGATPRNASWPGGSPGTGTFVGSDLDGGSAFDGTLDDVRFFTFSDGGFDVSRLNVRTLTVAVSGTGTGMVSSDTGDISCGAACAGHYPTGTVVTLTPVADAGSGFAGWTGACTGTGSCIVTLSDAANVTATFNTVTAQSITFAELADRPLDPSPFTVSATASSGLTVSFSSLTTSVCTVLVDSVTLLTTGQCTIRASQAGDSTYLPAPDVDRTFNVNAVSFTLSVSLAGSGIGAVSGPGIDCGSDCSEGFTSGATAMLTASAAVGSTFMGWSGACSGTDACFLTMDGDKNVVATFERDSLSGSRGDFDGDGAGDLVFHNADGRTALWLMDGLTLAHSAEVFGVGTDWQVAQIADLDGDGKSDLVWQNPDGRVTIYLMNGTTATSKVQILNAGPWTVTHTGDLDGDGKADLIFQNTDGTLAAWLMNGTSMTAGATILGPGTGWSITQVADFDGDGKDDLLFTHEDGRVAIWLMDGLVPKATNQILNAGSGWSVAHVGDFNGDGKADIVWQNTDGRIAIWLMDGAAMSSGAEILNGGTGWSVTHTGDFDGDGKADLVFTHTDGRVAIFLMDGLTPATTTQILNAGSGWSVQRVADLDGDGRSDIIWQHTDGRVAVWLMNGTAMSTGSEILPAGTGWSVSGVSQ
ncbi:MAG TPA: FG-GAP-like repeat-containing protein [Usitatibacter sp.]|nr:FG-GAP-like repeat-containing protein [Usitatibacter sp.]